MDNPANEAVPTDDALMSIGQFAEVTGLSVSAVRFYANQGVLHPADIDAQSGYRRFAFSQVVDGQLIRDLRRLEMPLPSITRALGLSAGERQDLVQHHLDELAASVGRVHAIAQSLGAATPNNLTPSKDTTMYTNDANTNDANTNDVNTTNGTANGATTLSARSLAAALRQVLPVASTDASVPHLMTVLLEAREGSLRVVATDRHRLAVRDLVPTSLGSEFTVVLAATTMADWLQLLDVDGDVTITTTETTASLTGALDAKADVIPATFPNYQAVLDTPVGVTTVTADPSAIIEALADRVDPVTLNFAATGLRVGDASDVVITTVHEGPTQHVLLDPSYVSDALVATVGREVVIDIVDHLQPLVIRSADDGTFTTLVMPVAPE